MTEGSTEEQLLEFLYACPVGLIECDMAGEIAMINPHAMQHLMPLAGHRGVGNLFAALEEHAPELRSIVGDFGAPTGRVCDGHRILVDLGSGRREAVPRVLACTLVKLGADRLIATLSDISEQVAQEQRLRQADTWFATLLDDVNDYATLAICADGKITAANACFTRQTGYDCADVMGRDLASVLGGEGASAETSGLDEQLIIAGCDGWHLHEGWQHRADGSRYWCQRLVVARPKDEEGAGTGFCVVLRDVPRGEAIVEDLRRLLTCDHLTGAANRRHFNQTMQQEHKRWLDVRHPLTLVLLDLDHFKAVNDTYGHPMGDALLRRVAEVCTARLPSRAILARLGGEEFGILLPRHDQEQATALAETLRETIAALEVSTIKGLVRATASFGVASLDETGGSTQAMIALADERLYAAKREGRNRVYRAGPLAA